jgi:hypothetical protein
MWDNRPKKESGEWKATSPDFKCKDEECAHVVWPDKGAKPKAKSTKAHPTRQQKPTIHQIDQAAYDKLFTHAVMRVQAAAKYLKLTDKHPQLVEFFAKLVPTYMLGMEKRNVIPESVEKAERKAKAEKLMADLEEMPEALEDDEPDLPF